MPPRIRRYFWQSRGQMAEAATGSRNLRACVPVRVLLETTTHSLQLQVSARGERAGSFKALLRLSTQFGVSWAHAS